MREADVDTVILGCTHYPLIAPMLQRMLGPGVHPGHLGPLAGAVGRGFARARRPFAARRTGEGDYRFLCTGDVEAFREVGSRFLQMPIEQIEHVEFPLGRGGMTRAATRARPTACARWHSSVDFVPPATGSALISVGETQVICTASRRAGRAALDCRQRSRLAHRRVRHAAGLDRRSARRATSTRGRPDGRTVEIQRLIGRALRAVVDFEALGERTVYLDCDVLMADGGTRCASITGAYVAFARATCAAPRGRAISRAAR